MTEIVQARLLPDVAPRPPSQNPYLVYLASLGSELSRKTMGACLDRIAHLLGYPDGQSVPWGLLRFTHTAAIRAQLTAQVVEDDDGTATPWSPSYINMHLTALRKVLENAWLLDQMTAEEFHRAKSIKSVRGGARAKAGRNVAEQEIAAMLRVCLAEGTLIGLRDAAMVAVLQSTGLRREELASARRANYDPGDRVLRIIGKGNTTREVHVHEVAAVYLGRWLAATENIRGPLFTPINRWGQPAGRTMSTRAVGMVIDNRRQEAGLPRLSPHDFRRTFAGALLDNGVDLARVQQLMGHTSPVTTAGYDRRPGRQRKAAVDTLAAALPLPDDLKPATQPPGAP